MNGLHGELQVMEAEEIWGGASPAEDHGKPAARWCKRMGHRSYGWLLIDIVKNQLVESLTPNYRDGKSYTQQVVVWVFIPLLAKINIVRSGQGVACEMPNISQLNLVLWALRANPKERRP